MADNEQVPDQTPSESRGGFWPDWLTPRRVAEFARNIFFLEQSVRHLQEENQKLHARMDLLQAQMTEQNARLSLLVDFVKEALSERIDARIDLAVRKLLEQQRPRPKRKKTRRKGERR